VLFRTYGAGGPSGVTERGRRASRPVDMEERRAAVEQMGNSVETYLRKAAWGHILAGDFYTKVNFASELPSRSALSAPRTSGSISHLTGEPVAHILS